MVVQPPENEAEMHLELYPNRISLKIAAVGDPIEQITYIIQAEGHLNTREFGRGEM